MRTVNRLDMAAPPDVLFALAAAVERWPAMLGHYRYVRELPAVGGDRTVAMGAARGPIPVHWTARQEIDPAGREIRYVHTRGVTRGMRVVWRFEPGDGTTAVTIDHELGSLRRWLRNPIAGFIIGRLFVIPIADRTLAGIDSYAFRVMTGEAVR